jgi:MFS family permease
MGARAVFTLRNDESYSSLIGVFFGPFSTLPAIIVSLFSRSWGAAWLITGGLVSLGAFVVSLIQRGYRIDELLELLSRFLSTVTGPMILLGLGLVWVHRRMDNSDTREPSGEQRHRVALFTLMMGCYALLSLGAFVVADLPPFIAAFETRWGPWLISLLFGPLVMLAMGRFIGMPMYLAETAIVCGLVWVAMMEKKWRRAALWGALIVWIISGLLFLVIVDVWS